MACYDAVIATYLCIGGRALEAFDNIKRALEYIDDHLNEPMSFESLAKQFHFSPYY